MNTNPNTVVVNLRINGISRHKQQVYRAGASKAEIKAIKERLKADLHAIWDHVTVPCKSLTRNIPQAFKDYHEKQKVKYGYVKYQIEREERYHGTTFYSVHAMSQYGGYLRNKLNYVEEKEVINFINNNPVV